jgi:hypothetical protein
MAKKTQKQIVQDYPAISVGVARADSQFFYRSAVIAISREQKVYADPIMRKHMEATNVKIDWIDESPEDSKSIENENTTMHKDVSGDGLVHRELD